MTVKNFTDFSCIKRPRYIFSADNIENRTIIGLCKVTLDFVKLDTALPFEFLSRFNNYYKKENPLLPVTVDATKLCDPS